MSTDALSTDALSSALRTLLESARTEASDRDASEFGNALSGRDKLDRLLSTVPDRKTGDQDAVSLVALKDGADEIDRDGGDQDALGLSELVASIEERVVALDDDGEPIYGT